MSSLWREVEVAAFATAPRQANPVTAAPDHCAEVVCAYVGRQDALELLLRYGADVHLAEARTGRSVAPR